MDEVRFKRYLYDLADQLGPSDIQKLPRILQTRLIHLSSSLPSTSELLTSFENLFKYLVEQKLMSNTDITLLQYILEDLGKTDLLYPFYEAHQSISTKDTSSTNKKNSTSEFLILLLQIGHHLSLENVRTLAYLLQDLLSRYKAATMQDGVELLETVRQRHYISSTHPCFLLTLLKDINREDLCCMVEQYKMDNPPSIDEAAKPCCSFFSNFKKKTPWTRREYRFRLAMKKMSDVLNPRDLDNMKLLSQSRLPAALLDKVETVLELFWLLEDHGLLSIDDLLFLEDLLEDRSYLIDSIYSQLSSSSQPTSRENSLTRKIKNKVTKSVKPEDCLAKSFGKMLKLVGNGLTQKETKHLKLLTDTVSESEKLKTGVELVSYWRRCNLVTEYNLDLLRKGLYAIGRQDLCQHIAEYNCLAVTLQSEQQSYSSRSSTPLPQQETIISRPLSSINNGYEDLLSLPPEQCTEDLKLLTDGKNKDNNESSQKDLLIQRQREEIASLRAALHKSELQYKQLEQDNNRLLLHNHELTLQLSEQTRQYNISTLTHSASKNGIFLSTPV